jgi:hypothetical protein
MSRGSGAAEYTATATRRVVRCDSGFRSVAAYVGESEAWFDCLADLERLAVRDYSRQQYDDVNRALWAGFAPPQVAVIDSALTKLPNRQPRFFYRRLPYSAGDSSLFTQTLLSLSKGDTFTCLAYTSTSEDIRTVLAMMTSDAAEAERNVMLRISTSRGAPVGAFSHMPQEREWLLPRGSTFRVDHIAYDMTLSHSTHILTNSPTPPITRKSTVISVTDISPSSRT